ncbi:MAG TPA: AbrB/MazE/SpoVT family DNA-binding domain-containing protein [Steroidobacteraceae bacterium]|nr:AbrB/MazE/SpoVT family DNA-binding domain-containing protein [Steroidobacteraceae bacterium]
MAATITLSSKYQIVIPQETREALNLSAGDELLPGQRASMRSNPT